MLREKHCAMLKKRITFLVKHQNNKTIKIIDLVIVIFNNDIIELKQM